MSCQNYSTIMGFLSSSELNRCKKNGLYIWEGRNNWIEVLKYPWLTRKLRRKIGHLLNCDLLPTIYKPVMGIFTPELHATEADYSLYKELGEMLQKQYLAAEDHYLLTGKLPGEV
jgi:hypothetical protein